MNSRTLTLNALSIALVAVATLAIRLPVPATQGYINLGDAFIFVTALLLGPRTGGLAGGFGSAMADLLGGYAHWAPSTLFIKGLEGILVGILFRGYLGSGKAVFWASGAACIGGIWMVCGYFLAESVLYGTAPALAAVGPNLVQAGGSLLAGIPIAVALAKAGIGRNHGN